MADHPRFQALAVAHEQLLTLLPRQVARNDVGVADGLAADLGDLADRARATAEDETMLRFVELIEGYVLALRSPDA